MTIRRGGNEEVMSMEVQLLGLQKSWSLWRMKGEMPLGWCGVERSHFSLGHGVQRMRKKNQLSLTQGQSGLSENLSRKEQLREVKDEVAFYA